MSHATKNPPRHTGNSGVVALAIPLADLYVKHTEVTQQWCKKVCTVVFRRWVVTSVVSVRIPFILIASKYLVYLCGTLYE